MSACYLLCVFNMQIMFMCSTDKCLVVYMKECLATVDLCVYTYLGDVNILTKELILSLIHLKFFDRSRPCASFIGTHSRQGLHFSPSCIVWESLDGNMEVVVSVVWFESSVTVHSVVLRALCISLLMARMLTFLSWL